MFGQLENQDSNPNGQTTKHETCRVGKRRLYSLYLFTRCNRELNMIWCSLHLRLHYLQVSICNGKECVEEMEAKIFCLGTSVSVHVRHVQLPGEETRSN